MGMLERLMVALVVTVSGITIGDVRGLETGQRQSRVPLTNNTDILDQFGEDIGSGEDEPGLHNATVVTDSKPHLIVKDSNNLPCLLATLNATMQVSYRVPEGIVHETYIALAEIQLPEDVHAQGVCGYNNSRLLLDWGNGTFHVNITFSRKEPANAKENATWAMTDLAVTYDLSDARVFPGASDAQQLVALERTRLSLYSAPVGVTHVCDHDVKVQLGTNERGVTVIFHDVKVAAFGVTSREFPESVELCAQEDESDEDEDILVPLIVACCLSAIVIIVIVAYVISRKVQEARDQSEYRQMP